ncbi:Homoserine dehydrogenase, partial [hydrothermal vent metagenome]
VAGAIPVIRTIRHSFASDRIVLVQGIVNGTGNYILSRMTDEGKPFDDILKDAQALGYAEADPALDVGGGDSAHKIAILASLAFRTPVDFKDVYTEGITAITPEDIIMAGEFGYRVKLLALARRNQNSIDVRVHPAMVPKNHMIANVNGALNAVEIIGDYAGPNTLQGPGAGAGPTASAVVADIVDIGGKIVYGGAGKVSPIGIPLSSRKKIPVAPVAQVSSEYYLRFTVPDRPGVLAEISGALGRNKISISSMIQRGRKENEPVSVVLMTHTALESDLNKALDEIARTDVCQADTMRVRIVKDA